MTTDDNPLLSGAFRIPFHEIRAEHVGRAVVFLSSETIPTTGAVIPIDGGVPEAFPR